MVGLDRKEHRKPIKLRVVLERAWKDYEEHGGIPHEEFWKGLTKEVESRPPRRRPPTGATKP